MSLRRGIFDEARVRKLPEWMVLVVSTGTDGQVNLMPAGWSMFASHEPPMYAVSVGRERHSHGLIRLTGEFVVAHPGPTLGRLIRFTGPASGRDVDMTQQPSV